MGKVIAIANQKGGVGKTTTSINLGSALSGNGKKVLLIDLDEQANATIGLGFSRELIDISSYDLLVRNIKIEDSIYKTTDPNLDLIPASIKLSKVELDLYEVEKREFILEKKVEYVRYFYDFILIDCPPSLGVTIDNALYASDSVLIPVECEYFAYDALTQMVNKVNQVQSIKNKKGQGLTIDGVL